MASDPVFSAAPGNHPSIARSRDIVGDKLPTAGLDLSTEYFFHFTDFPFHFAGDLFCRATVP